MTRLWPRPSGVRWSSSTPPPVASRESSPAAGATTGPSPSTRFGCGGAWPHRSRRGGLRCTTSAPPRCPGCAGHRRWADGWCRCGWPPRDPGWPAYLADPATWLDSGGPYRIAAADTDHHRAGAKPRLRGAGPAPIRRVHLHLYPAGDLDRAFADFRAAGSTTPLIPPGQIALAKSDPKLAREVVSQPRLELIAVGIGTLAPELRRAVALATPADAAAADVGPGSAVPADGLLPQGLAEYLPGPRRTASTPRPPAPQPRRRVPELRLAYPDDAFHRRIAGVVLGGFAAGRPAGGAASGPPGPVPDGAGGTREPFVAD